MTTSQHLLPPPAPGELTGPERPSRPDQLTVLVEAALDTPAARCEPAAAEIAARVKDGVGVTVAVQVVEPDTLERSVGKMRRVIDQWPR
jgi:phenylacetate-CoA ligase